MPVKRSHVRGDAGDAASVTRLLGLARASWASNPERSRTLAEKAHALQPGSVDAAEILGGLLLPVDASRAKRLLRAALDAIDGYDEPTVFLQRARIECLLGHRKAALHWIGEALRESLQLHEQVVRDAPLCLAGISNTAEYRRMLAGAKRAADRQAQARREAARIAKLIPSPQDDPRKAIAWARRQLHPEVCSRLKAGESRLRDEELTS